MFIKLEQANLSHKEKIIKIFKSIITLMLIGQLFWEDPGKEINSLILKNLKSAYNKDVRKNNWENFFSNHDKKC